MRIGWTTLIAALALCSTASGETSASRVERELLASVNQARRAYGLAPLRWNELLATAARRHAEVMAARGSAQHGFEGEPGLPARVKRAGVSFHWLSENVAQGAFAPVYTGAVHEVGFASRQHPRSRYGFNRSRSGGTASGVVCGGGFFPGAIIETRRGSFRITIQRRCRRPG